MKNDVLTEETKCRYKNVFVCMFTQRHDKEHKCAYYLNDSFLLFLLIDFVQTLSAPSLILFSGGWRLDTLDKIWDFPYLCSLELFLARLGEIICGTGDQTFLVRFKTRDFFPSISCFGSLKFTF